MCLDGSQCSLFPVHCHLGGLGVKDLGVKGSRMCLDGRQPMFTVHCPLSLRGLGV